MIVYPAIDLRGGECVRLLHGRFDKATTYDVAPSRRLTAFSDAGAEWVHIVDLDGAAAGLAAQHDLIGDLARTASARIQCGGGVRSADHVEVLLQAGASRIVVGSLAVSEPATVRGWIHRFGPERLTLAIDVRAEDQRFIPALKGWTIPVDQDLWAVLEAYPPGSLRHLLVTDIGRDGAMTGPNLDLMTEILRRRPDVSIQASGGVATLNDIAALRDIGCDGVVVGRALYEERFNVRQAVDVARAAR